MNFFANLCLFSGAHFDVTGRLAGPAIAGVSNPGRMERHPGGASLNAASIAAALGLPCSLSSPIGADADGAALRNVVATRGIGDALFELPDVATGTYTAIMQPDGAMVVGLADLDIYEQVTANQYLQAGADAPLKAQAWFLPANLTEETLGELCSSAGERLVVMASVSPAKSVRLKGVLGRCDLLFTNRGEAAAITGLADAEPRELAQALAELGARAGTISDGGNPLLWWNGAETGMLQGEPIGTLADVNGAGDALAGATLAALAKGEALHAAVRLGMAAARLVLKSREPYLPGLDWLALEAEAKAISAC